MAKTKSASSSSSTSTSTKTKSSSASRTISFGYLLNILAYAAVCIGGIALFIAAILSRVGISASITGKMNGIANAIGWAVLCLMSAVYISHRKKLWMWIVWAIAVIMIVTSIIL